VTPSNKLSETRYLSLTNSTLSDRSKRARCFCALHLTTSKTVHMLRLYCTADAQDSYVWRTCHFWILAISWERWACTNTGHLSGFCHRICKRCTIRGFTNVRPGVMSGRCFITAHSKMVLIWQTLVVTPCRHAHHNSAWHSHSAVTPTLPTGPLYNTNQSRQSSWLHKRRHFSFNLITISVILSRTYSRILILRLHSNKINNFYCNG
jgi:hypothetical protein